LKLTAKPAPRFTADGAEIPLTMRSGREPEGGDEVGSNRALTLVEALSVTTHVPVPLHPPPLQPANLEPDDALAVRVTTVPAEYGCVQSLPHEIPDGELVTLPDPVRLTVSVGLVLGGGVPVVEPLTPRETVSPAAVKFTFEAKLPVAVGRNRTTTFWLAPAARVKEPPETIWNGDPTLAPPDTLDPEVFCTVNVRSTVLPVPILPKLTVPDGDTLTAARATALTADEHALSLPERSTAETRTQ
jgi:hypothetical protein